MEESQISGLSDLSLLMQSNAALCPESQQTKKHLRHIIKIGISFTLIIFFPISGCLQETILKSYEDKTGESINAYLCLSIQMLSAALACIYTPAFLAFLEAKPSFIIAASIHLFYTAAYIYPNTLALYIISGLLGAASSLIWLAQGIAILHNSTDATLNRNYSLFFVIFQVSFLISNAYIYVSFGSIDEFITETMLILLGGGFLGLMLLPFISVPSTRGGTLAKPGDMIRAAPGIATRTEFLYMIPAFVYLGLETCFIFGPFPSAISSMKLLGDNPHQLVGLIGLIMSCGKVAFGLFSMKFGADASKMAILGFIGSSVAYYISFIYIPTDAIMHDTYDFSYMRPNLTLLCIAAFFLGAADVCFFTTTFSLLGKVFRGATAATAISISNFVVTLVTGINFYIASSAPFQVQIIIIVLVMMLAVLGIFKVDNMLREKEQGEAANIVLENSDADVQ